MEYREIRIVDSGADKYEQVSTQKILGRQYDNNAVSIRIIRPEKEKNTDCFMIVTNPYGSVIDHIYMENDEAPVLQHISKYSSVNIGFYFIGENDYIKNCAIEKYSFAQALNPSSVVEITPEQQENLDIIISKGFIDVQWKEGSHNTLVFKNFKGKIVKEIELSGFVQEQADLGEKDEQKETFVKGKKTSNLENDGDGISPFATQQFVEEHVPNVDFSEIEKQIEDVIAVAEGKTKSFTVANLSALGTILGIDTSVVSDEYSITSTTINYKDKIYELKQGDLFIIVDTGVPDYWVSVDNMKIYKMETTKVDLTEYVKNTDYATSDKAGVVRISNYRGMKMLTGGIIAPIDATTNQIDNRHSTAAEDTSKATAVTLNRLDYAVKKGLTTNTEELTDEEKTAAQTWLGVPQIELTLKDNGAYTLTINKG